MPKLNKIRLTRIRYNNNLTGIDDAIIDMDGVSTLLKLANGGGKTVLIQMLLAPYVSGRRRNFKDRPFSDYFKDPIPSFIVEEWIKDNRTGKFLVGLMVRKSQYTSENNEKVEDGKLDLYGFVAEYSEPCEYDIENLQLIRQHPKSFLPFSAAKEYLETVSRTYPDSFRLYNLATHASEKKFREKLTELNLDRSEWDQLWEFNQDESGLSSLCEKYNSDQKLVRDVFVPAVEQKIDQLSSDERDFSQIRLFRDDLREIARMQLNNIDNLENQKEREQLLERLKELIPSADQLIAHQKGVGEQLHRFAAFLNGLNKESGRLLALSKEQEQLIEEGENELARLEYEILSQRYYKQEAAREEAEEKYRQKEAVVTEIKEQIRKDEQMIGQYELTEICNDLNEKIEQKAQYEGMIDSAKMSEHAMMQEAASVGSALYRIVSRNLEQEQNEYEAGQSEVHENEQRCLELKSAGKEKQKDLNDRLKKEGGLTGILRQYEQFEKKMEKELDLAINHTLAMFDDEAVLQRIVDDKRIVHEQIESEMEAYRLQQEQNNLKLSACTNQLAASNEEKIRLENQLEQFQKQLEDDERVLEKRRFFIRQLGMSGSSEENVWALPRIEEQFDYRIRLTQENIDLASEMLVKLKHELENLKTGTSLQISEPIRNVLEELDIVEMYGSEWLKNSSGGESYRKRVLENHPFLPYALVMTDDEIARFQYRMKEEKLFTSEPIPIISRNILNHKGSSLDTSAQGLYFYLSFNEALIDPDALQKMIEDKEGKIRSEQDYQKSQYEALEELQKNKTIFYKDNLDKKEYVAHLSGKQKCEEKINKLLSRINKIKQQEIELKKEQALLNEQIDQTTIMERRAQRVMEQAVQLFERFMEAARAYGEYIVLHQQIEQLQASIRDNEQEIEETGRLLQEKRARLQDMRYSLERIKQEANRLRIYEKELPASGEEKELRGRFEALQKKLQASQIDFFEEQLAGTIRRLEELKKRFEARKDSFAEEFAIQWDTLPSVAYSFMEVDRLERQVRCAKQHLDQQQNELNRLTAEKSRIEGELNSLLDQINDRVKMDKPLEKAQTRMIDLRPEKKRVSDLIRETKKEVEKAEKRIALCRMLETNGRNTLKDKIQTQETSANIESVDQVALQERYNLEVQNIDTLKSHVEACRKRIEKLINEAIASLGTHQTDLLTMMSGMKEGIGDGEQFKEVLNAKIALCQAMVDKLAGDLKKLELNKETLYTNLLDYLHKMNDQIKKIDHSTTITLNERRRQMLQIEMPDWHTMENMYKVQIEQLIRSILDEIVKHPNDMEKIIGQRLSAKMLVQEVIGYQTIKVRLYKIEQGRESRISWSKANATSGAEGFICAFVIVSALLAYRRRNENRQFTDRKQGSLLLMDNPFAKVQSKHIVDALMNLCKATNTQFIAFSDVENSAIINAFDNIYTLRKKRRLDGKDTLEIDRAKRPEDEIEKIHIRIEQQRLF